MSERSNIQWTDATHNFWRVCTKVSPGCANCYAETLVSNRLGEKWGKGAPRIRIKDFNAPLRWNKKPWVCDVCGSIYDYHRGYTWCACHRCKINPETNAKLHRRRVFSLSLGDWLDPEAPVEWLADMLDVVRRCDNLDWLLCTKRPELWRVRTGQVLTLKRETYCELSAWLSAWVGGCPPANVMLLASVENQDYADERVPALLRIPAARRGLSIEPLLGPVDLTELEADESLGATFNCLTGIGSWNTDLLVPWISWVIVGGESGDGARPCNVDWIRSIVKQCKTAQVPVFVKQLGGNPVQDLSAVIPEADISDPDVQPEEIAAWEHHRHNAPMHHIKHNKGGDINDWPEDLRIRQFYASS